MNYFMVLLVLIGMMSSFLALNTAYGMWTPLSPEDLLKESKTIFVGIVTEVNPVDVKYQSQVARNGTIKEKVGPETITLEEYTVGVEDFLKNPQETDTIKVLRATVSGVPTGPSKISGFDVGDRVLFYLPKDEEQTHFAGQYLPESFRIPEQCDAVEVLDAKRIDGGNSFAKMQKDVEIKDNFTAGVPIQFRYDRDVGTLFGQSFEVSVGINNVDGNAIRNVFHKTIPVNVDPCKWIGSAQWEFVPQEGEYRMNMHVSSEDSGSGSSTHFSVIGSSKVTSPMSQLDSGIPFDEIQCKDGFMLIQKHDGLPACVTKSTKQKLVERGWAKNMGMLDWMGNTYYFETFPISPDAYVNQTQMSFHGVTFRLFPQPFNGGLPVTGCGGQYYWVDTIFANKSVERLKIFVNEQSCKDDSFPIVFSNHIPQAGLMYHNGDLRLLVARNSK